MKTLYFAYPGDLDTPTGGYGYDRNIIAGMRVLGWQVELIPLGEGYPFPAQATLLQAEEILDKLPPGATLVVDGLAYGAMADMAPTLAARLDLVALVHHPLCRETGLSDEQADYLLESERRALELVRHVIVTSNATAEQVCELFEVAKDKVTVVLPGTEKPDPVTPSAAGATRLLSVGTVVPRKGYDLLFAALGDLMRYEWRLDIVGGLDADPECLKSLMQQAAALGLTERIQFRGAVPSTDLPRFYQKADVFVLASRYEGYGMAYTEALAHGLPVIGSGAGAVRETLPDGASVYCGTEDVGRLRQALEMLIADRDKRQDLAAAARRAASELPDWHDAAAQFADALEHSRT